MKKVWIIDLLAAIGFGLTFFPGFTGYDLHEWIGIVVGVVLIVHLIQHWQWVVKVTRRFSQSCNWRVRLNYVLDALIALTMSMMILTGLVISKILMLPLAYYETWRVIHVVSSYVGLVLVPMKLAFHWDWIAMRVCKGFLKRNQPGEKSLQTQMQRDRRHFLRGMCVGVAAAAVALVEFRDWQADTVSGSVPLESLEADVPAATVENVMLDEVVDDSTDQVTGFSKPADAVAAEEGQMAAVLEPTAAPTPTPEPTYTVVVEAPQETGRILCSRKCSYPGSCRRYQDKNENGKCDLGEPIW
ncbi:MAG: DUF4405 domain-containing protein [Anaerolineaceae bacterium]|nr:DUF4405 domain-containing protein [Anaerolineaceae bacterium]